MEEIGKFVKMHTDMQKLKQDWEAKVKPYAEKHGAEIYGSIGGCLSCSPPAAEIALAGICQF